MTSREKESFKKNWHSTSFHLNFFFFEPWSSVPTEHERIDGPWKTKRNLFWINYRSWIYLGSALWDRQARAIDGGFFPESTSRQARVARYFFPLCFFSPGNQIETKKTFPREEFQAGGKESVLLWIRKLRWKISNLRRGKNTRWECEWSEMSLCTQAKWNFTPKRMRK